MIERYRRNEMAILFEDNVKFKHFLEVEIKTLEAFNQLGVVPNNDLDKIKSKATFDVERIRTIEQQTKHDVIAFTRAVSESLGEEKKWVHYGLTSTDVVDTALGLTYKKANDLIEADLVRFLDVLKQNALKYKHTPCIGRTHGIHADITSFGLKFALYYDIFKRHLIRFKSVRKSIEAGKISGAVGNFANTPPFVQDYVCEALGLESAAISTQTLQRDRHAEYLSLLALIASSIEQIAVEIRHLQRTEVKEVSEYFDKGQKGSSAMPHKKNPIASENMTGCARMMRGYMHPAFENIALWHERDISHSSVERVILPDAMMLLDYMLNRYAKTLDTLIVYEQRMEENIYLTNGVIFSQRVLTALINKGLSREESYDLIQPLALKAYEDNHSFKTLLNQDKKIQSHLTPNAIDECFTLEYYLKEVDTIFTRVGIEHHD